MLVGNHQLIHYKAVGVDASFLVDGVERRKGKKEGGMRRTKNERIRRRRGSRRNI